MILCTFMETFLSVFIYCFPIKKKETGNVIHRIEIWLYQLYHWRYSTMKNLQYPAPSSPPELYLECAWASVKENIYLFRWVIIPKKLGLWRKCFNVEADQTFLKVRAKNLVEVTRIGKVMGWKRPPTLRELSFRFHH